MTRKLIIAVLVLMVAMSSVSFALADKPQDDEPREVSVTITLDPKGDTGIAGHKATAAAQAEGVSKFNWKSSAPKVASVSAKGVILFKKPGEVTITATAKGPVKGSATVTLKVVANENATDASRVYLKGNFVYADILYKNEGLKPLKKLGKTTIALSGLTGFETFEAKGATAKAAIKPGETGFMTFKLMKVKKAETDLTKATAAIVPVG